MKELKILLFSFFLISILALTSGCGSSKSRNSSSSNYNNSYTPDERFKCLSCSKVYTAKPGTHVKCPYCYTSQVTLGSGVKKYYCPKCNATFGGKPGETGTCPKCGTSLRLP